MKLKIFLLAATLLAIIQGYAQPTTITWQGKLLDADGNSITQNNVAMTFAMFDASTGGNQLWPASGVVTKTVNVVNGLYSLQLGTGTGDDIAFTGAMFAGKTPWLEVKVGTETLPRTEITTVPFALISNELSASGWENPGEIGKTTPNTGKFTSLEAENLKITTGASDGKVLTSDADGNAGWETPYTGLTNFTESNFTYNLRTGVKFTPNNAAADVDLVLQPKRYGAIIAQQPDGTYTGGNRRGALATDLQRLRTDAAMVASANYATIVGGSNNTASGESSTAMGSAVTASGLVSTAMGSLTTASGNRSTAMGSVTIASGDYSTAMGRYTTAPSYYETALGSYNTNYTPVFSDDWDANDRLFVVGNGTNPSARSNALTIFKNANTIIGGRLTINSNLSSSAYSFPANRGFDGEVLTSNGEGGTYWSPVATGTVTSVTGNAPISVETGTTTPVISISPATTTAAGSMSAADKTRLDGLVSSQWTTSGSNIYYNAGNVGIGTSTTNAQLQLSNSVINRKIVLYQETDNDHQFYGFGINSNTLRYQVLGGSDSHVFYAGTSATTSSELFRIQGDGQITIPAMTTAGVLLNSSTGLLSSSIGSSGQVLSTNGSGEISWTSPSGGTVTDVSGTSPISVTTGTSTPAISIAAATTSTSGSMSAADKTKLDGVATNANNYVHPSGDGSLHVPATGTTNNGKVLTAGATAGSLSWTTPPAGGLSYFTESQYDYNSKYGVKLTPARSESHVDFVIQPKGLGALVADQPDGTTNGGNNRGAGAVDLQLARLTSNQVASGSASFIGSGFGNTASGNNSVVPGGYLNTASGDYSFASGVFNSSQSLGETVIGLYATEIVGDHSNYVATDRLFVVGNGDLSTSRRNAFTILKNANTTIGGTLEINKNGTNTSFTFPSARGTSGQFLKTAGDGTTSWSSLSKSDVGLGSVENTALSTWAGTSNITTLGTITTGSWHGTAIAESYIGNLGAAKITSGTFDNARINWAAPGTIGSTTRSSGAFTSLSANNGLSVSAGTVNIKPSGSGGTSGQVLTTDGAGNATWQNAGSSVSTQTIRFIICVNGLYPSGDMDDHFIGEVIMFAGPAHRIPDNFLECKGQTLQVSDYSTLYSIIGNTYGGTPPSTFNLPNLTGKVPLGL